MKIQKVRIPDNSLTQQYLPVDYTDAFASEVFDARKLSADEVQLSFWTVMPSWVNALMKLRNILVRPFGLKVGENADHSEALKKIIRVGEGHIGLISLVAKSENETVLLLSDKHLDAYISVLITENNKSQSVTVLTLVKYHNRLGKLYFFFIRPFHLIVVKSMMKSTLKRIVK